MDIASEENDIEENEDADATHENIKEPEQNNELDDIKSTIELDKNNDKEADDIVNPSNQDIKLDQQACNLCLMGQRDIGKKALL